MLRFVTSSDEFPGPDGRVPGIRFVYERHASASQQITPSPSIDSYRRSSDNQSESADSSSDAEEVASEATEKSPYEAILSHRQGPDGSFSYFVKFRDRPYRDCRWIEESEYLQYPNAGQALKRYHKKHPYPKPAPFYDPAFDEIDRVIGYEDGRYLVKWMLLQYDSCTWETDVDEAARELFEKRNTKKPRKKFVMPAQESFQKIETSPVYKGGLELFPYQLEGLNWLVNRWYNRKNCILADEMGLGKTVQAVAFLQHVYAEEGLPGPFLVIAPLSTLMHWQRTVQQWTDMNAIVYQNTKQSREIIRKYEFFYPDGTGPKFDVLITQYEMIMNDNAVFAQFKYSVLIVDEAHRLKNANSKLLQALANIESDYRILLTGTPLQNTVEELQSLLEFLHPGRFTDITSAQTMNDVMHLRNILKPHLLRRLKADVDKSIAPKEETIIDCQLTKTQKQWYRAVLEMNAGFLSEGAHLQNISIELRKVCLHPYLIDGAEDKIIAEKQAVTPHELLDCMIRSSGKLILLDKLLPKLKANGNRVLIFSQMTRLLDILEDYLNGSGYSFLRIDGAVKGSSRQQLIDRFNAEGSDIFIFLLCTRAGGQGITLNAADTVIIFDSDWNPQNDLQAQARCHRIGQKKIVKVYRLLTKGTYEEVMFEAASKKLGLGHAILDKEKTKENEIDKLLRQGAYHILNDVEEENFGEEDIDQILSRSRVMRFQDEEGSSFAKANFDVQDADNTVDLEDPDFWKKMLPQQEKEEPEADQTEEEGYMRTRKRVQPQQIIDDEPDDDETSKEWKRIERERLQQLLMRFGWNRWDEAQRLGLKRHVVQVKLAARAFLRLLLYHFNDVSQYNTARMLLNSANSEEFDPNYVNEEDAVANDNDFVRQPCMLDPDFVQMMHKKGGAWIKRIEMLYFTNMAVEKADYKLEDIITPACQGNLPAPWWTLHDDKCLIYGTWKHGFTKYEYFAEDDEITFTCKSMEGEEMPASQHLTPRLKKLSVGIRKYYTTDDPSSVDIPTEVYRPKHNLWRKRDKSTVLQQMLHAGVPLKPDGSYDWEKFRETCGFTDKTDEQVEKLIDEMMCEDKKPENSEEKEEEGKEKSEKEEGKEEAEKDQDEDGEKPRGKKSKKGKDGDNEKGSAITAGRIKQRFVALTRLRRLFLKFSEDEVKDYFNLLPRWRNVPRGWTNQMEFVFFKEICERGWGVCGEILKLPTFDGVFDGEPPTFITLDTRVIRRLDFILKYVEDNTLDSLREKEAVKPKRKQPTAQPDEMEIPDVQFNEDGSPVLPLNLTSSSWIISFGKIVTDRPGFHTERYVYPAGFKSSRLYTSTLDVTKRCRYTCEILDVGDPVPLFKVSMDDHPDVYYEGPSPTSPWNHILKKVLEMRKENNPKSLSISGPEYYGLAAAETIYVIQRMEGIEKCVNYQMRAFAPPRDGVPKARATRKMRAMPSSDDMAHQRSPPKERTSPVRALPLQHFPLPQAQPKGAMFPHFPNPSPFHQTPPGERPCIPAQPFSAATFQPQVLPGAPPPQLPPGQPQAILPPGQPQTMPPGQPPQQQPPAASAQFIQQTIQQRHLY